MLRGKLAITALARSNAALLMYVMLKSLLRGAKRSSCFYETNFYFGDYGHFGFHRNHIFHSIDCARF